MHRKINAHDVKNIMLCLCVCVCLCYIRQLYLYMGIVLLLTNADDKSLLALGFFLESKDILLAATFTY